MSLNESILVLTLGAFVALVVSSLNRPPRGVDYGLRLARLERKVDQIFSHLDLKFDEQGPDSHLPKTVVDLARAGRKIEAIKEYRTLTGASLLAAKQAVESISEHPPTGNESTRYAR